MKALTILLMLLCQMNVFGQKYLKILMNRLNFPEDLLPCESILLKI